MLRQILFAGLAMMTLASPASAQRQIEIPGLGTIFFNLGEKRNLQERRELDENYVVLDRQSNDSNDDRVVFDVGRREGPFTQLRIRSVNKIARITGIEILFGNGRTQKVDFYEPLMPGEVTPAFDLDGDARRIRKVTVYKRRDWRRDRGTLELLGLEDNDSTFSVIETERADRGDEVVEFNMDRRDGNWDTIKFRALDTRVAIERVGIVFGNGQTQRVQLDQVLRPGQSSREIDLRGNTSRFVKRVVLRLKREKQRRGRVQLLGLKDDRNRGRGPAARVQDKIPEGWVLFGSQTVGRRGDKDRIDVGRDAGVFDSIVFRALNGDIYLRDVEITYANGRPDRREVNLEIPAGFGTPVIDLKGSKGRQIRSIEFTYRATSGGFRRTATLQAYGHYDEDWLRGTQGRTRGPQWIMLGAQGAQMFSTDNDSFVVGKRLGTFKGVRVVARDNEIRLYGMEIIYGNGSRETVPIYGKLAAGQSTQPFDLKGRERFIDRVNLRYRTSFSLKGEGTVEVWGLR